jgi:putative hydrolase
VTTPDQPGNGDNPFAGVPFLGDLMRMLGGQVGGANWDAATQMAVSIATGGTSEANVDPTARIELEQLARIAELHVEEATGLTLRGDGHDLRVVPVTRSRWAQQAVGDYRPLLEKLSSSLHRPPPVTGDETDPMAAVFGGLMQMMAPVMLSMTTGSMVGHLAERALGTYHLPLPRPAGAEVQLVAPNIDAFADEWSIEPRDLRLWVCLSELTHHAVLSRPHVQARLRDLLERYVSGFRPDPAALESALGGLDPTSLGDLDGLRSLFSDPAVLLGVIRSPEQQALLPAIEALVAAVVGYVDLVIDRLGHRLLGGAGRLTEALRRRRVEAGDADRFVERLLGLELTQAAYERGGAFVAGVVERAGDAGLARLWERDETLPTPAEIDAPGLWLARIEFIGS